MCGIVGYVGTRNATTLLVDGLKRLEYAMVLIFSDGHETGIYTWEYLHSMGINQEKMWQEYLQRMDAAGAKREPAPNILKAASAAGSCGSGGCGSK